MRLLIPTILLATLFGGCTRKDDGVVRLQFSFWGSVLQQEVERGIVERFENTHPGVKIDLVPIGPATPRKSRP